MNTDYTLNKAYVCPKHKHRFRMNLCASRTSALLVVASGICLTLLGCDGASGVTDAATNTETPGTFTFKGQLPENFGIDAIVFYHPFRPELTECQRQAMGVGPGEFEVRRYGERHVAKISNEPQSFSFDIPLSRSVTECNMGLARIDLEIRAKFGEQRWQTSYSRGGFRIVKTVPDGAKGFSENSTLELNGKCSWLFQESKTHLELGKMLTCKGAGAYLPIEQLPGKTVSLDITINPEEKPSMRNRWIKQDNGWRPCQGNEQSDRCQSPPIFKTFKMNGKTCTIYPNCTE